MSTVFRQWTTCEDIPYNCDMNRRAAFGSAHRSQEIDSRECNSASRVCVDRLLRTPGGVSQRQHGYGLVMTHLSAALLAHTADLWMWRHIHWLSVLAAIAAGTLRSLCFFVG